MTSSHDIKAASSMGGPAFPRHIAAAEHQTPQDGADGMTLASYVMTEITKALIARPEFNPQTVVSIARGITAEIINQTR